MGDGSKHNKYDVVTGMSLTLKITGIFICHFKENPLIHFKVIRETPTRKIQVIPFVRWYLYT